MDSFLLGFFSCAITLVFIKIYEDWKKFNSKYEVIIVDKLNDK